MAFLLWDNIIRAWIYACICVYMRPGQAYLPLHMSKMKALAVIFVIQFEPPARFSLHFVVFTFSSVSCLFSATQSSWIESRFNQNQYVVLSCEYTPRFLHVCMHLNVHKVSKISLQNVLFWRTICMQTSYKILRIFQRRRVV